VVAAVVLAAAGALLAGPGRDALANREGVDLEPGLLQVDADLRGAVALGNGVYAQLSNGGLLITKQADVVWRGVDHGSPVTAGLGHVTPSASGDPGWPSADGPRWDVDEHVDHALGNLAITGRTLRGSTVRYTGRVYADRVDGPWSRPVTITITRRTLDSRVLLDVEVPGADVVAVHQYRRDGYVFRGGGVRTGDLLVSQGRFPMVSGSTDVERDPASSLAPVPVLFSSAGNGFALDGDAYAVLDLRHRGRVDTTAWQPRLLLRLHDGTPEQMVSQHATDAGLPHPLPTWSLSGAVVSVRGSTRHVQDVVDRLQDAQAVVAAVLVRDGGQRARYPGWHALVDRLSARDVRVLTAVSPSLALSKRTSGPDDEPQLLAVARARGYLVTGADGRPLRVATPDADHGSVPGALVDLTNPDAVRWYTGVLTDRMRRERVSGWAVQGGDELPPGARLHTGDPTTEHDAWPRRWAAVTRQACEDAGRPDCLLLQSTADEGTAAATGAVTLGRQATDWSDRGLGAALPAIVNGGVSGLPFVASPVGGTTTLSSWWGRDRPRTDELLERWTELETFGPLLVTADGDRPASVPQVWDSPSRLAAFARMSRVFAALADYRRAVVRHAVETGLPAVRPLWLAEPDLSQGSTASEYLFGDSMLVVPVLSKGVRTVQARLPPGRWVELFTGVTHQVGSALPTKAAATDTTTPPPVPREVTLAAPPGSPVVLYRAEDDDAADARAALVSAGVLP
jgi:alpha-glucosidase (family GH31 glycosyl hydrolase)